MITIINPPSGYCTIFCILWLLVDYLTAYLGRLFSIWFFAATTTRKGNIYDTRQRSRPKYHELTDGNTYVISIRDFFEKQFLIMAGSNKLIPD